jgi:phage tail sheath gpL-like
MSISPSGTVSFNQIPVNILVPGQYIEYSNAQANTGLVTMPSVIAVLGQRLASGKVAAGVPTQIFSPAQAAVAFGNGSMLCSMLSALYAANSTTQTWAIAQDDNPAGTAAIGSVLFGGPATQAGTFNLYVAYNSVQGVPSNLVQIPIAIGATPAQAASALVAEIALMPTLPITATVDPVIVGKVNFTATHKGLYGNDIDLRTTYYVGDAMPAGLTATITPMSGGTANPDLTATIAAMGDTWYTTVILPYYDQASVVAMQNELVRRLGPMVQKDGLAFGAVPGTTSQATSFGLGENSQVTSFVGTHLSPTHPSLWAAVYGAVSEYYGNIDPARPLQTLTLTGILPPAKTDQASFTDRNLLLTDGISTTDVDAGGNVLIERAITTYKTNAQGLPDTSYLDVETLRTLAYVRFAIRARIAQKFPRMKLGDDGNNFSPGQAIVTPSTLRNEIIALFTELEEAALVENLGQFTSSILVVRDTNDRSRVNAMIPPELVGQFRVFAAQIQFLQ